MNFSRVDRLGISLLTLLFRITDFPENRHRRSTRLNTQSRNKANNESGNKFNHFNPLLRIVTGKQIGRAHV